MLSFHLYHIFQHICEHAKGSRLTSHMNFLLWYFYDAFPIFFNLESSIQHCNCMGSHTVLKQHERWVNDDTSLYYAQVFSLFLMTCSHCCFHAAVMKTCCSRTRLTVCWVSVTLWACVYECVYLLLGIWGGFLRAFCPPSTSIHWQYNVVKRSDSMGTWTHGLRFITGMFSFHSAVSL